MAEEKGDVTAEACRVLQLTEELIPFGVTAAKLRDVLRGKRLQGSKAIQTAAGNVADKGMLKAWDQTQVDELIQLMVQQKVLREEKEKVGGQKGVGKGKGWKAPKRLREAANAAKLRNGDLTLLMSNCPKASAPEATDLGTPPATESGEAQDPASPAPKRQRLRKVKDVPMESEAAAPIDVEDLEQLVACEVPDPEDPAAEQESGPKDEKVPDSKRFQSLFGGRKSTNRQSKATRRRSSLNKQDEDKEEEGWPPVPSDSSGDELVWIGGGQRPSPVRRHRPSAACPEPPEPPREPLELTQQEPVQATSPGRRLPWQSNAVPSQPPLQQAPELPQTSEPQATSPGRRLPWQSNAVPSQPPLQQAPELPQTSEPQVAPAPPPMSAPPAAPSDPSRAARRNQLRVST